METRQRLAQLGHDCLQSWGGRMASLQELPSLHAADLQHTLPAMRGILGDLYAMQMGWQALALGSSDMLDPGMPWHWLGLAGAWEMVAEGDNVAQDLSRGPSPSPFEPVRPRPLAQSPKAEALDKASKTGEALPPAAQQRKSVVPTSQFPQAQEEDQAATTQWPQGHTPQGPSSLQSTTTSSQFPDLDAEAPQEEGRDIIFRRLDDFAAFVQMPVKPSTVDKKQRFDPESRTFMPREDAPESQAAPDIVFKRLDDFATFVQSPERRENPESLAPQPKRESRADAPSRQPTMPHPFPWEREQAAAEQGPRGLDSEQYHPYAPTLRHAKAMTSEESPEYHPDGAQLDWGHLQQQLARMVQSTSPQKRGRKGQVQRQAPPSAKPAAGQGKAVLGKAMQTSGPAMETPVAEGKEHPTPSPILGHEPSVQPPAMEDAFAQQPPQGPRPEVATPWSQPAPEPFRPSDDPMLVFEVMEALHEQLMRDFQRYYGS